MTALPFLALLGITLIWITLPLIPAIRELLRPTDAEPLAVVSREAGNPAFFAERFHDWLEEEIKALPPSTPTGDYYGKLPSGARFLRVRDIPEALGRGPAADGGHDRVVLTERPVRLTGGELFLLEVCARDEWMGGPDTIMRAIYGERDVHLGPRTTVLRWAHAQGDLRVGPHSTLHGRFTATRLIQISHDTVFDRLSAPTIEVGERQPPVSVPNPDRTPWVPPVDATPNGDHLRINGDLDFREDSSYDGHLVVIGQVRIGRGARISGNIKAHGEMILADDVTVAGAVTSRTTIRIGNRCQVAGPVIAEQEVELGEECTVGGLESPTSIVAPRVCLGTGATVHGQVNTTIEGRT